MTLFKISFKAEIESGMFRLGQYNVFGRSVKGAAESTKLPLDSAKIEQIRLYIERLVPHGLKPADEWKKCYTAINEHLISLKKIKILLFSLFIYLFYLFHYLCNFY